jgi:outer membrane protein, heavy metal efflux system
MKNYKCIATFVFFIITFLNVKAQSIDSLLSEAYRNNPQLTSLKFKIKAADFSAESANALPPPTLAVDFNSLSFSKPNIWDDAISQNLTISQMIPLGGKIGAMVNMAKTGSLVAKSDYEAYKVFLTSKIKMSYYSVWQMDRNIEIRKKFIGLLNELLKSNESLYQTNRLSQGDILMLQSEIANYETQLVVQKNKKEAEVSNLNKLIGREISSKNIVVSSGINMQMYNINEQSLVDDLKVINPSLLKMNGMVMMNKAEITANEKELIPDLMVGGMLMRMPQGMLVTTKTDVMMLGMGKTEYMYGLMASVTLPFAPWSRGKYDAKTQELEAKIKSIEAEKLDMEREMIQKVHELCLKLKSTGELISLYNDKVIPLEKNYLELQKTSFFNNNAKLSSVIEADKMLLMNEMNLVMAQADYQMALADLEMMVGKQISN